MMYGNFKNSPFYDRVIQARDFMFGDITKTLKLAENKDIGAPNFLLALGLCCYTEYWGEAKVWNSTEQESISKKIIDTIINNSI
jgi:hypothetical protein